MCVTHIKMKCHSGAEGRVIYTKDCLVKPSENLYIGFPFIVHNLCRNSCKDSHW